jgi:hypothetical protein
MGPREAADAIKLSNVGREEIESPISSRDGVCGHSTATTFTFFGGSQTSIKLSAEMVASKKSS